MKFGKNLIVEIWDMDNGVGMRVGGVKKGVKITSLDFGLDLHRRRMEGVIIDPREEIEILQGIEGEKTTGEDIVCEYAYGDKVAAIILAGTIAKKHLSYEVKARALEIGGINTVEQNKEYLAIAIQKMLGTEDSIGGVIECLLPMNIDLKPIKGEFSNVLFELIEEVSAIQFGNGVKDSKSTYKSYEVLQNKVLVTFAPHMKPGKKIASLAGIHDITVESILRIVLI